MPPLAERYRVVAPDLRGAGWTDAPADGYTVGDILADVLALLDVLGLRRVGLVAHDFSAFVRSGSAATTRNVSPPSCASGRTPTCVSSRRCSPVSRSCGSSRLSPRRGWGRGPCAPTGSPATCWPGPPPRPTRSPMRTWRCSPDASTRRGILRPARRCTGTSSSRRWAVSWPRRRTARGGSPYRPSRSWGVLMPASGRACSTSTAAKRTTSPATSSTARHITSPMTVPTPS
ncbi:MAG: alpha/beta fold hydrolase [Mycobacterium sp.]